jgi:hypothetical protein
MVSALVDESSLPSDFEMKLYETVAELKVSFAQASELRFAFPRAFELAEDLQNTMSDIRSRQSSSSPYNTALILLHVVAKIIHELE